MTRDQVETLDRLYRQLSIEQGSGGTICPLQVYGHGPAGELCARLSCELIRAWPFLRDTARLLDEQGIAIRLIPLQENTSDKN